MTTDQFFTKYNGRYIDYDGKFGNQCVDEMRQYIKDVLGYDGYIIPAVNYAKNIFYNFPDGGTKQFTKIYNGPTNYPLKGDIIFFKTSILPPWLYGWAGHVEIVSSADGMNMVNFAQNWPTGSPCHFQPRKYKDCLGWLHPRS